MSQQQLPVEVVQDQCLIVVQTKEGRQEDHGQECQLGKSALTVAACKEPVQCWNNKVSQLCLTENILWILLD